MSRKRIFVTIDTEMDADSHWKKTWPPEYASITEGIPKFFRPIWDKYDVHPIYFLSPEVLYDDDNCKIFRDEVARGAIVGAHLHPEYIEPQSIWGSDAINDAKHQFPCVSCDDELEYAKLQNLTNLIEEKVGVRPVWYRAARFGADTGTFAILKRLGYKYDSSLTPGISWVGKGGPDHRSTPSEAYIVSDKNCYEGILDIDFDKDYEDEIVEVPVTIGGKRWGFIGKLLTDNWLFYKWLRPTHMTYFEMKSLVRKKNQDVMVMMFHSMEIMIKKTPYVRWRWMQKYYLWRLDRILRYCMKQGYEL